MYENLVRRVNTLDKEYIEKLKKIFHTYVIQYHFDETEHQVNFDRKIKHTEYVCDICVKLAKSLDMSQKDIFLAEIIGLFHDIGRFPQYLKYKTYDDSKSENHALLSTKTLIENHILDELDEETKEIIIESINNHNLLGIEKKYNNDRIILFSKLIRDADKIDIFRIIVEAYENNEKNHVITRNLPDSLEISDEVYNCIMNNELVPYKYLKTLTDSKLLQIEWIYDLNFKISLDLIKSQNYIERIFNTIESTKRLEKIKEKVYNYLVK